LRRCHIELNYGIQITFVVKKDAQIRPLTAYMRLLGYATKLACAYIKYPKINVDGCNKLKELILEIMGWFRQ